MTADTAKHFDAVTALEKILAGGAVICLPTEERCTKIEKYDQDYVRMVVGKDTAEIPTLGFQKMYGQAAFADAPPEKASGKAAAT